MISAQRSEVGSSKAKVATSAKGYDVAKEIPRQRAEGDWGLIFPFDITDACGCEKKTLKAEGRDGVGNGVSPHY